LLRLVVNKTHTITSNSNDVLLLKNVMPLKVALIHDAKFPVAAYGGTERVVWWLSKGLSEKGIEVTLVCRPGSFSPYAKILPHDFSTPFTRLDNVDILHYFYNPPGTISTPYLATIGGNGKRGEPFAVNSVFVSQNHAGRHGASAFVYNGIDPDDYEFRNVKEASLLFLAKAAWRVKNVKGAVRIARRSELPLHVIGGKRWPRRWRGVIWEGMLGGKKKAELVAKSRGLLFPVLWHEPFGLAVVEAMVSGTPVLASPFGSLPELITPETGRICKSEPEFVAAVSELASFSPERCRDRVLAAFHYRVMTASYLATYEKILSGYALNSVAPQILEVSEPLQIQR
jgi:hypothetical protein